MTTCSLTAAAANANANASIVGAGRGEISSAYRGGARAARHPLLPAPHSIWRRYAGPPASAAAAAAAAAAVPAHPVSVRFCSRRRGGGAHASPVAVSSHRGDDSVGSRPFQRLGTGGRFAAAPPYRRRHHHLHTTTTTTTTTIDRGSSTRGNNNVIASSSSSASSASSSASGGDGGGGLGGMIARFIKPIEGLWGQLVPMASMFYWMALANGILDALKDTLVVTAFGGAEQIPYLTVYAVLPASLAFVAVFAKFSARWGREKLFYLFLGCFMAFFALFTLVLYPNAAALHPVAYSQRLAASLPSGLGGGVAVLTNWTYTLFYVSSELWGDVILSLLFWGMANETTRLQDAGVIYPLLGVGANLAQASSGALMKWVSISWQPDVPAAEVWGVKLRFLMGVVMACGVGIAATHAYIMRKANRADGGVQAAKDAAAAAAAREEAAADKRDAAARSLAGKKPSTKRKTGLVDALRFVVRTPEVLCLAIMSIAQGLSSILFQVAWKGQLRILHPSPQAFSAFMGDVQLCSGCLTCALMLLAPWLFKKLGWAGTLAVTPKAACGLGWAFFGFSIWMANTGGLVQTSPLLPLLAWGGSLLYVIERAAKFSLFKPAEEMVYITLNEESRTKGKAAVDVLGAQVGKTGGSFLQQGLLLAFGSIVAALPCLMFGHTVIVVMWLWAVRRLDRMHGAELQMGRPHGEEQEDESAASGGKRGEGGEGNPAPAAA